MRNTDPARENKGQGEKDTLDLALDAALVEYSDVEPRAGLEQRILAHLQSKGARLLSRSWWRWSAAGAIAVLLALTVALAWRPNRATKTVGQTHPPAAVERVQASPTPVAVHRQTRTHASMHARSTSARRHARQSVVVAREPKLDQFPSPEPLTREELALVRYVRQFPRDALAVAIEQEEFEKEIQQLATAGRQGTSSSTDEQER